MFGTLLRPRTGWESEVSIHDRQRYSCLALLAALLGAGVTPARAAGIKDWSAGLIRPDHVRLVTVARTVADPKDGILCSDFSDWLEKNDYTLFTCEFRRVVARGGNEDDIPIFIFSGLVLPLWWNGEPGQYIGGRGRLPPGRWQLEMMQIEAPLLGGDARIVLAARKPKGR